MARRNGGGRASSETSHGDFVTDHKDSPGREDYPHGDLPGGHIDMPSVHLKSRAGTAEHADFTTDHKDSPGRDDYPHGDLPGGHIDMAGYKRLTGRGKAAASQHLDIGANRWKSARARKFGHVDLPGIEAKPSGKATSEDHADFVTDHKDNPERDDYPHGDLPGGHIDHG